MIPTARLGSRARWVSVLVLAVVLVVWLGHHIEHVVSSVGTGGSSFTFLWAAVFASLVGHLALSWCESSHKITAEQQTEVNQLRVAVNVPVYNEDPDTLLLVLKSILAQTRKPQYVQVVDDGSVNDLSEVEEWWYAQRSAHPDMELAWQRKVNGGKRTAQLTTFRNCDMDIFATMDSDTVLEERCIEEGLKPFIADKRVTSVASVILALNNRQWLARLTDPWMLTFQLAVRSAMSRLGCVMVNSGSFAMYRADVVRDGIAAYESETFCGNPVHFSDDSLLTLFAHLKGRTVQQPSSFAFTVLPETINHHLRQQLRWMRGSTIRSVWRFRYLPMNGIAYWEHFLVWVNFILMSLVFVLLVLLVVLAPLINHEVVPVMLLFSVLVSYATALKYLTIHRSDQSFGSKLLTYLLSPAMLIWTTFVLRPLRFYAIATCWKTGWGTRDTVEVGISTTD